MSFELHRIRRLRASYAPQGRSTMAEAVFRSLTSGSSRITHVDSAGTGAYHTGDSPDPRTLSTLADNGIVDYNHAARKIQSADFTNFNYILAMDRHNLRDLQRMRQRVERPDGGSQLGKLMLFGDFGGRKGETVVDPYYGADNGFDIAYEQMVRLSEGFQREVLDSGEADRG